LFDTLVEITIALEYWLPGSLAALGFGNDEERMPGGA
jgi:hypothetical protein